MPNRTIQEIVADLREHVGSAVRSSATRSQLRRTLTVTFDVTDLRGEELDYLTGEVIAQAERSEGHPDVPVLRTVEGFETAVFPP